MTGKRILMTGGCGFIGSNFINYLIDNCDDFRIINFDFEGIGSNRSFIKEPKSDKQEIHHLKWDISYDIVKNRVLDDLPFDYLINFAAESHVDRSITTPEPFIRSNVMGTMQMLELARKIGVKRFVQISTDEVAGSVKKPTKETAKYKPSSVYSASKASAELICNAYKETYGMDIVITRCGNNYGKNQFEEKLIPKVIKNALNDEKIPVYDKGEQVREWVYVEDHISDIIYVAEHGKSGQIYNVGQGYPMKNIDLVKKILNIMGKSEDLIEFKPNARLGHDFKYSLDLKKLIKLKGEDDAKIIYMKDIKYVTQRLSETIKYYESQMLSKGIK
jgi:dTDP-glucose 4,6-dehydratase